jgi:hypothetical protein
MRRKGSSAWPIRRSGSIPDPGTCTEHAISCDAADDEQAVHICTASLDGPMRGKLILMKGRLLRMQTAAVNRRVRAGGNHGTHDTDK